MRINQEKPVVHSGCKSRQASPDEYSVIENIRKIKLFSLLTDEELQSIAHRIEIKRFAKGEVVIYPEDTNDIFYAILSGKVKISKADEDGKEIILAIHQEGDFFGELSLIDGKTCPATALAVEVSTLAIIERDNFHFILKEQSKVTESLLQLFCYRLRESWGKLEMLTFDNAAKRIKMFFLMKANKYGIATDTGITISLKLTHQDIADMTGVTRETVTRVINEWKKHGDLTVLESKLLHLDNNFFAKLENVIRITSIAFCVILY